MIQLVILTSLRVNRFRRGPMVVVVMTAVMTRIQSIIDIGNRETTTIRQRRGISRCIFWRGGKGEAGDSEGVKVFVVRGVDVMKWHCMIYVRMGTSGSSG